MKEQETKLKFIELRAQGLSYDKIAKQLKVSKQTLINWSKDLETEIANLKAIELEGLLEKYYGLKRKRIELFGETLTAIKKELDKRDLKDIPTVKLFILLGKYADLLKREGTETVFKEKQTIMDLDLGAKTKEWEA